MAEDDSNETRLQRILASVPARNRTGVDFTDLEADLSQQIKLELDEANPKGSGLPGIISIDRNGTAVISGIDLGIDPGNYDFPVDGLRILAALTRRT